MVSEPLETRGIVLRSLTLLSFVPLTLALLAAPQSASASAEDVEMAAPHTPQSGMVLGADGNLNRALAPLPADPASGWSGEAVQPWDVSRFLAHQKAAAAARDLAFESGMARIPSANQDKFDQTYFDIELNLDPSVPTITSAVTTMRATVVDGPLTEMELDFADNMTVSGITSGGVATTWTLANDLLTVALDRAYTNEEEVELVVSYSGRPRNEAFFFDSFGGSPMIWTLSQPYGARTWWPSKDWPSDKADEVDIRVTAPAGNKIVSNGVLVSETDNGTVATAHWNSSYPIATYLVQVGVYPYSVSTGSYDSIGGDTVPLVFYDFPSQVGNNAPANALVDDMMGVYEGLFGEYPFSAEKYGHNESLFGGGMEHQTCTSLGAYFESIVAHELTHQWWGDMVTCDTYNHVWLNEGFATYGEALWFEEAYGQEAYFADMASSAYFGPGTVYVEDLSNFNAIFDSNLSYNKGSWVLHMLRHVLGDDDFFGTLAIYRNMYGYDSATTEEFRDVAESVSGLDLDAYFQQWIYGEGFPIYSYDWSATPVAADWTLDLQIDQVQTGQIFTMPIDIVVTTASGTETFVIQNGQATANYQLTVTDQPLSVDLDPDHWILRQVMAPIATPTFTKGILLVNGVSWDTYGNEIVNAYEAQAFWGDLEIEFWDYFAEPTGGYPSTLPAARGHGAVPGDILGEYEHVIWVGNNFDGDLAGWLDTPMYAYLQAGGNVLLLSRMADQFLNEVFQGYLGVDLLSTVSVFDCIAVEPGFTNIGRIGTQSFTVPFDTAVGANTTLLYEADAGFNPNLGMGAVVVPPGGGEFNPDGGRLAFLAGRPYRWNASDLSTNVMRIFQQYFGKSPVDVPGDAASVSFGFDSVGPNPFSDGTTIRFGLGTASDARVDVLDVAGRRVRTLASGPFSAGTHTLRWDGIDDAGHSVAAGVYFARVVAGAGEDRVKLLRVQ